MATTQDMHNPFAKRTFLLGAGVVLAVGVVAGVGAKLLAGGSSGTFKADAINTGDTAWVLAAAALVSVQWVLFGYSLAFGKDIAGGILGGLGFCGLKGVGYAPNPPAYAPTIPHLAYMIFQAMFAIITPALIIGAFAERIRFRTLVVFVLFWSTLVYDPIAHGVWNPDGWLHKLGALDFAGGTVVHASSGFAALAAAIVVGRRRGDCTVSDTTPRSATGMYQGKPSTYPILWRAFSASVYPDPIADILR